MTQYGLDYWEVVSGEKYSWDDYCDLVAGLNAETPLGRIVQIRTEKDPNVIKNWSPELKRINAEWQQKRRKIEAKNKTEQDWNSLYNNLDSFINNY